jgi:hypothetical protein
MQLCCYGCYTVAAKNDTYFHHGAPIYIMLPHMRIIVLFTISIHIIYMSDSFLLLFSSSLPRRDYTVIKLSKTITDEFVWVIKEGVVEAKAGGGDEEMEDNMNLHHTTH